MNSHHSKPKYRVNLELLELLHSRKTPTALALQREVSEGQPRTMSWTSKWDWDMNYGQAAWVNAKGDGKGAKSKQRPPWREKDDRKEKEKYITGFDGTKLSYKHASSSASKATAQKVEEDELGQIKSVLKDMASGTAINASHPVIKRLLTEETRDTLKIEQNNLNMRKKCQRRVDSLRKNMEQKEKDFNCWKQTMKQAIKDEEIRYKEMEAKLLKELQDAETELARKMEGEEEMEEGTQEISDTSDEESKKHTKLLEQEQIKTQHYADQCLKLQEANQSLQDQMTQMLGQMQAYMQQTRQSADTPYVVSSPASQPKPGAPSMIPFRKSGTRQGPYTPSPGQEPKNKNLGEEQEEGEEGIKIQLLKDGQNGEDAQERDTGQDLNAMEELRE